MVEIIIGGRYMVPSKLKPGDEVRVIAPSRSMKILLQKNSYRKTRSFRVKSFIRQICNGSRSRLYDCISRT